MSIYIPNLNTAPYMHYMFKMHEFRLRSRVTGRKMSSNGYGISNKSRGVVFKNIEGLERFVAHNRFTGSDIEVEINIDGVWSFAKDIEMIHELTLL